MYPKQSFHSMQRHGMLRLEGFPTVSLHISVVGSPQTLQSAVFISLQPAFTCRIKCAELFSKG